MFSSLMAEERPRRNRRRTWILTGSLALHLVAVATLAGAEIWRVEAVAEPPLADVFEVQLPPPLDRELPPAAAAHRQPPPAAPPARTVQPPPPRVVQPDPAALDQHPEVPPPAAAEQPPASVEEAGSGNIPGTGPRGTGGTGPGGPGDGPGNGQDLGDSPLPIGGPISRPQIVPGTRVQPVYTETARQAHLQGVVVLQATIDESGNVIDIRILKRLPMGLDAEAVKAVSQWRFTPATLHGRPVKVFFSVTVQFEAR